MNTTQTDAARTILRHFNIEITNRSNRDLVNVARLSPTQAAEFLGNQRRKLSCKKAQRVLETLALAA